MCLILYCNKYESYLNFLSVCVTFISYKAVSCGNVVSMKMAKCSSYTWLCDCYWRDLCMCALWFGECCEPRHL